MAIKNFSKMAVAVILDLFEPEIASFYLPSRKTHPRTNMKCIGSPVAEIWPFAYLGGIWNPILGEREVVGGQRWQHSKERWWFPSYRLSIVTVAQLRYL